MPVDLRGRKHRAVVLRESLEPAIPASICAAYLAFGDVVCAIAMAELNKGDIKRSLLSSSGKLDSNGWSASGRTRETVCADGGFDGAHRVAPAISENEPEHPRFRSCRPGGAGVA
jgi:hypothetical protein